VTTGLVVVVGIGGIVVLAVVGGAEVLGVLGVTVGGGGAGCAGGAGAAAPGCSEATRTPIHAVAPPEPSTTAPVRNRIRALARSRARAACGRCTRVGGGIICWSRDYEVNLTPR
jgi:hypothetical protein